MTPYRWKFAPRRLPATGLAILCLCALGAGPRAGQSTLPPEIRAKLLMALLGLVVLGLGLVAVVVLIGRTARRLTRRDRSSSRTNTRSTPVGTVEPKPLPPEAHDPAHPDGQAYETRRIDETGPTGE